MHVVLRQLFALALAFVPLTLALGALFRQRSRAPLSTGLAVVAGFSSTFASWIVLIGIIVRLGLLYGWLLWVLVLGSALVSCSFLLWRMVGERRSSDLRMSSNRRMESRQSATWRTVAPRTIYALALVPAVPFIRQILDRTDSLRSPTSWYYWQQVERVAYEGSIPEHSIEWGTQISSFDFHTGFTGPVAALHLVGGGDSLAAAQWTRAGALLLTLLGVGFVVRALGGRRTGVVAAAFGLLALSTFAVKLSSLRPETLAYGPVLLGVGFAFLATVRRDRGLAAVAALTFAASVQIHGVGGTFGACLLLGVFCACLLPPERGATDALGQRVRSVLWVGGGITAATFAAGIIVTGMATPAGSLGDVPDLEADGYDPTYAFLELSTSGLDESEGIGYGAPDNEALFRSGLRSGWIEVEPDVSLAIAAGLIVAAVAAAFATPRARRLAVFTLAALGAVFLLSLYLSSGWETYVPRRTGFQRVLQLWFAVVVVVAVVLPSVLRRARVVTSVLVLGLMSALWAQSLNVVASYASGQPSARQIEAIEALPIERGATILTNAWTQGYVSVHTPGVGLLDGQAPYLDEPLLRRANGLLTSARAYFEDPTASPFDFGRFEVDYVLVATEAHAIGTPSIFSTAEAVSADPRLTKLTDSAGMVLLQVDDA